VNEDGGLTWFELTSSAEWPARGDLGVVSDGGGSILIFGGNNASWAEYNDVWRSQDGGVAWHLMTSSAPWASRSKFGFVMNGTSALVFGGTSSTSASGSHNDVWRSDDGGVSWVLKTSQFLISSHPEEMGVSHGGSAALP